MINQEQMNNNWNELMSIIDKHFEGEQKENILRLHGDFEDEYKTAPASGRPNYHNCFRGGWLDHTIRVIETSLDMKNQFIKLGVKVDSSDSEVVLAALFHDLGKLGDLNESYYITEEFIFFPIAFIILIFGEILPKTIIREYANIMIVIL